EEDFFELGGHSLLATQVASRAREAFGVEVPLRTVFEAPTVARLAGRIEVLRGAGASPAPPMEWVPRTGPLPLSFAQQRLWVVDRLEPGSAAYNMPFALRLSGELDTAALRASLDMLVARHETLRTTFSEQGGVPVQVIHPAAPVALRELDLRDLPEADREAEAERLASDEALRPFDLARGPLLRSTLLRVDEEDHVLLFNMHHIVSDGWSMQVLVREVSALYGAFSRGEEPRLPDLPVQYADFAVWQRSWLGGETLEAQIGFWRERLAGAPPLLEIPTDRPRRAGQSALAATHHFTLSPELSRRLRELSRREGATLFMTLLAGWQALLGRHAGQDDVVVGTPVAGRGRRETEGLIGFFVNTLALRAHLAAPTWSGLLRQVRAETLGAYDHQDLPFERLVEELGVERSLTHTPVFQAMFTLAHVAGGGGDRLELGELGLEPFGEGESIAKFDLDLSFADGEEGLRGALLYVPALFDASTIARMVGHLGRLLEAVAADPECRPAEVELLAPAERAQLLATGRAASAAAPAAEPCLHELFQRQAAATPNAPAVLHGAEALSYGELERRTARLATLLRDLGVGPEAPVGVCLEWSPELVAAALGVMRAGGAYLPLDPAYPPERLAYMLEDAGARVLLTRQGLLERFGSFGGRAVALDAAPPPEPDAAVDSLPRSPSPDNVAYVIYTSGSTGRPKGVAVEHRAAAAHFLAFREFMALEPADRVLAFASPGFDVALDELFPTLFAGAALVLRDAELWSPAELLPRIAELGVTVANLTPAYWLAAAEESAGAAPAGLRLVIVGGEAVPAEGVLRWRENTGSPARLLNAYGPTETVVTATAWEVPGGFPGAFAGAVVPIGGPFGERTAYVLDAAGGLAPAGVAGELHLGGPVLARGYLGRPEGTAAAFVPDPFSTEAGARMYRTGDRARWLPGGALEFLGRTDQQIKVRGFRIETGEIEAALLDHPGVREAVVVAREDVPGRKRLVAYVVPEAGAEPPADDLKAGLASRLPEYMVPAAFVTLAQLPLSVSGKVDRRALPAPEFGAGEDRYVAPRTPAEEVLAGIWSEVLGVERVGVEEGFFELGGHSLLATQVVSRARRAFGVEVPLRALFEAPTVAGLAGRIDELRGTGAMTAPPMERVPRTGPLPLSFAQQRLWVVDRLEPGSAAYNMPFALRLRGALDVAALRASLDALVARHETLRTTFSEQGGVPVQVIHPAAPVAPRELDLRGLPEAQRMAEAGRLASEEALRPFDLAHGPLLRSTLLRLGEDDHVLLFTLHHVVSDGWSIDVLVREVSALYGAFSRGEEAHLPDLPVQYADFAVWQRAWLAGEVLEEQIGFWKEALGGAPPLLEIPTDHPRAPGKSPLAASHRFALSPELSEGLRTLSRREGATLFMTLLAGWQALLGRYAGQEDVVVGSPISGRTRHEVEGLIGFFVNMLSLRADLGGDPTWTELVRRVRAAAVGAYEHQELPFERLVEELGTERSLAHAPVFQVTFALDRSAANEALALGELAAEPFGAGGGAAKFDLALSLDDGGDALAGSLTYRASLFEAATIERMAGHLEAMLEALSAGSGRRVSEVSLLRAAEREQVVEAWNRTARPWPRGVCIHELFEAQAALRPDAPALVWGDVELTYAQLDARANRLARHLGGLGVGPESRVGVLLERGVELI
ncbi:MAG: amino acid adenylation domain-containing protein, partial [Longimicrobiaceae bacterium]